MILEWLLLSFASHDGVCDNDASAARRFVVDLPVGET
jgi:hypothetical protein